MTPRQVGLVGDSFRAVAPERDRLAGAFFAELFARDAVLWRRFRAGITMRDVEAYEGLAAIVASLDRFHPIVPVLEWLAFQGARRSIGEPQYRTITEALVAALATVLEGRFTSEHREAWKAAAEKVSDVMLRALASEPLAA